jgi:alkanesulfonate monooxygenase SsuD/methylene tetrahydromethanopterin reductase-like flavin-dependent oxidoreductase (luciferase family)
LFRKPELHLAVALDGAGSHPAAWRESLARSRELFGARYWAEHVREAERGLLDFVTLEDSHRLQSTLVDAPDERTDRVRGRLDAIMLAARVAPLTEGVGIVAAADTTVTEPFLLSTQIATLDFVSRGRAGWLLHVSTGRRDATYVGPRLVPEGEARFDEAAEYVEVVRELWDSWDDDAEIRDPESNRFFDRGRVHHIDHAGTYFSVKGPSITPRPPQGQPVIAALVRGVAEEALAAANADVIIALVADEGQLASATGRIAAAVAAAGREPAQVRVLGDVVVFLDHDRAAALERRHRLDALAAEPYRPDALVFTGTPSELADVLIDWRALGYDGFRLRPGAIPHDLQQVTRALVRELAIRGAFRPRYEADTLRGLLGLGRPDSRFGRRSAAESATT